MGGGSKKTGRTGKVNESKAFTSTSSKSVNQSAAIVIVYSNNVLLVSSSSFPSAQPSSSIRDAASSEVTRATEQEAKGKFSSLITGVRLTSPKKHRFGVCTLVFPRERGFVQTREYDRRRRRRLARWCAPDCGSELGDSPAPPFLLSGEGETRFSGHFQVVVAAAAVEVPLSLSWAGHWTYICVRPTKEGR